MTKTETAAVDEANEGTRERHTFWQPPEERGKISDAGKKWLEGNAEAIEEWNQWAQKHGTPLTPLW